MHWRGSIRFVTRLFGPFELHAVRQYTHLGTVLDEGDRSDPN